MPAAQEFQRLPVGTPGIELVLADSRHAFGRHMHDEFGIGFIERGAQVSLSGRGTVEAFAGDLITVNPGEVHDGKPLDTHGRRWRMLYVEPTRLLSAADDIAPGTTFEFEQPVIRHAGLAQRFHALLAAALAGGPALQTECALLQLIAPLRRATASTRAPAGPALTLARDRMDDDPTWAPTLADMASAAGLSRYQFLRGFTRLTGLPPHAYLLQRRVQQARRLVRAGRPLAEVAAECGFADQSHMTRCFSRSFGLTPGAFRPG